MPLWYSLSKTTNPIWWNWERSQVPFSVLVESKTTTRKKNVSLVQVPRSNDSLGSFHQHLGKDISLLARKVKQQASFLLIVFEYSTHTTTKSSKYCAVKKTHRRHSLKRISHLLISKTLTAAISLYHPIFLKEISDYGLPWHSLQNANYGNSMHAVTLAYAWLMRSMSFCTIREYY